MPQPKYNIYPSLLDAYSYYLNSGSNYERTDMSEEYEQYKEHQFQSLIDKINRVPFSSKDADKGTCFNDVVDSLIHKSVPSFDIVEVYNSISVKTGRVKPEGLVTHLMCGFNSNIFTFRMDILNTFLHMYPDAISHVYTEAVLPTIHGDVKLYGFIDELMPQSVHDIKTVRMYTERKFFDHSQHLVYPYCLINSGVDVHTFEYNITDFTSIYKEVYVFDEERDTRSLKEKVEDFIEFLESNKNLITDKKIFNNA